MPLYILYIPTTYRVVYRIYTYIQWACCRGHDSTWHYFLMIKSHLLPFWRNSSCFPLCWDLFSMMHIFYNWNARIFFPLNLGLATSFILFQSCSIQSLLQGVRSTIFIVPCNIIVLNYTMPLFHHSHSHGAVRCYEFVVSVKWNNYGLNEVIIKMLFFVCFYVVIVLHVQVLDALTFICCTLL